jgi:hypothetical protein
VLDVGDCPAGKFLAGPAVNDSLRHGHYCMRNTHCQEFPAEEPDPLRPVDYGGCHAEGAPIGDAKCYAWRGFTAAEGPIDVATAEWVLLNCDTKTENVPFAVGGASGFAYRLVEQPEVLARARRLQDEQQRAWAAANPQAAAAVKAEAPPAEASGAGAENKKDTKKKKKKKRVIAPGLQPAGFQPNVVIILLDACSRANYHRHLPKTMKLLETMGPATPGDGLPEAFEFMRHQVVEEGTMSNTGGMWSGIPTHYSHEWQRDTWIWKIFAEHGYATMYAGEACVSNWVYEWARTPRVDHLLVEPFCLPGFVQEGPNCLVGRRDMDITLEAFSQFLGSYEGVPKFAFLHADETHEETMAMAETTDQGIHDFIERTLRDHPDTLIALTSDHGMQFGEFYAQSVLGKREQKLPAFFMVAPGALLDSFPEGSAALQRSETAVAAATASAKLGRTVRDVLRWNGDSLTTHFDFHATLAHIARRWRDPADLYPTHSGAMSWAGVENFGSDPSKKRVDQIPTVYPYSSSVFYPIPIERKCNEAAVPPMWCVCGTGVVIDPKSDEARALAAMAMRKMTAQLTPAVAAAKVCAPLELRRIILAQVTVAQLPMSSNIVADDQPLVTTRTFRITFEAGEVGYTDGHAGVFEIDLRDSRGERTIEEATAEVQHAYRLDTYGKEPCKMDLDREDHNRCVCANPSGASAGAGPGGESGQQPQLVPGPAAPAQQQSGGEVRSFKFAKLHQKISKPQE